jgi:WD40 repeat protein
MNRHHRNEHRDMKPRTNIVVSHLIAIPLLLAPIVAAQQPRDDKPRELPAPYETIKDKKQFNAVQLGPGNTFSIVQTPPDFQLYEFAISSDGNQFAMGWGSGRIEIWDLHAKKRASEFKSEFGAAGVMQFDSTGKQLIVTGSGGKIAYLDLPKGTKSKSWTIPLGKYKYDVHEIVLDPNGKWLAYADEESSKVLDLSANPPVMIVDLKDAYSIAVSQDGSELWTVDRSELVGLKTGTWEVIGHWPLKAETIATSPALVRTGITLDGKRTVAVPSAKGLVIYTEPEMSSEFATDKPTSGVAFARGQNVFVNFSRDLSFVSGDGKILCKRSYKGRRDYGISDDGQWLAISQFNSVDLWRTEDILRDCTEGK